MNKKTITAILSVVLFFGVIIGGMALFETYRPAPKTSNFYTDGLYLEYLIHWRSPTGGDGGHGWVTLTVKNGLIHLNASIPNYYPGYPARKPLYRELILNHTGDTVYYKGEKVILPFFYTGGKIISQYKDNYTRVTQIESTLNTIQGGIIQFQRVYSLYTMDHITYKNGTLWNENDSGTYEYGYNTNLLFFMNCIIADDPIISMMMNLTYPSNIGGSIFYTTIQFGLSLHKTNMDLGPIDYFSIVLLFLVIGLPVIILVGIPVAIIWIYRWAKNRKGVKNE